MFEVGTRFVVIYLTCGMISLARLSSASNSKPTDLRVASVHDLTIMLKWNRPLTTAGAPDSSVLSYTVSYMAVGSGSRSRLVSVTSESAQLALQENKRYNIYVKAVRSHQSPWSDVLKVDTNDLVPAKPIKLRLSSVRRLTVTVVWSSPPVTATGITDTSKLKYYVAYQNLESKARKQISSSTTQASLNLDANTRYKIQVKSYKEFRSSVAGSWSDPLTIKMNESVPTKPPANVKVVSSTLSSINVSWGQIPINDRNGVILGYVVFYREGTSGSWTESVAGLVYSQILTGLISGKSYSVKVAGYTKTGRGTKSGSKRIIVGGQFITTTRKVTTQKPTTVSQKPQSPTVSEKPQSTSRTASVTTVGTVQRVSTEVSRNTTDPYAETSTRSPGETNIRRSSVPSSVNSEPGDHSHYSTPEADSVGRAHEATKENPFKKIVMIGVPTACAFLFLILLIVLIGRSRKRKQSYQNSEVTKSKRGKRSKDVVTRGAFSVRYEPPSGNTTLGSDSMTEGLLHTADEPDQAVIVVQEANGSLPRAGAEDVPLITAGDSDKCDHLRVDLSAEQKRLEEGRASGLYESIGSLGKAGCSNETRSDDGKSDDEERYVTQEQIDATRDAAQSQAQADYKIPNGHYKTPKTEVHYKTPKTRVPKDVPEYENLENKEHVYETLGLKNPEDPVYENTTASP